jgi:ligand-binding sensor domain-containing protein/signal transduction histidine kinase
MLGAERQERDVPALARIVSLGLTLLLGAHRVSAGDDAVPLARFLSDVWRTEDGLPHNAVQALVQTRDGYLWLGTPEGLVRFDGVRFTAYAQPHLKTSNVHALLEDHAGRLWIGTYGGGLYRYDRGRFQAVDGGGGLASPLVRALFEDRTGRVWVGTHGGGVSFGREGRLRALRATDGLSNDIVRVIYEDNAGAIWIGTNAGGLNRWDGERVAAFAVKPGPLSPYTQDDSLSNDNVLALWEDGEGVLWIGTDGGGLWRLRAGRIEAVAAADINGVRRILEDGAGNLWIGTDGGGIHRRSAEGWAAFTGRDGLPSDIVLSLAQDRERNIWVGTRDGLVRLKPARFAVYTTRDGLANDFVTAVHGSRDGTLWVGTRVGLDHLDGERAIAVSFHPPLPRDTVLSLLETGDGTLWVGTRNGLFRARSGRTQRYTTADGLASNYVGALSEGRDGGVWVGSRGALSRIASGTIHRVATLPPPLTADITAIHEDAAGEVWVGTDGAGLGRLRDGQWRFYGTADGLTHPTVTALYGDERGDLWIATRLGLNRWREGRLRAFTTADGLRSDHVFSVVGDGKGSLWLTSYHGIARVDLRSVEEVEDGRRARIDAVLYGKSDGMKTSECNNAGAPAAWRGRDGRLWFATVKGLAAIDPAHVGRNDRPPPVIIEEVRADGEALSLEGPAALGPDRRRLEFHYTALSFAAPEKLQFRYKLEGFDPDWIEAGTRRVGYYTNVPAGEYRFRVMAANEDGVWNTAGDAFRFSLRAHFLRRPAFWAVSLVGLAVAGRALYRVRVRRLTTQFAAVLAERNRIAREIHDTLAQGFVGIAVQLDTVAKMHAVSAEAARDHLDRARILARSSLAEARRTVWALRAGALETADLAGALREVADQLSGETPVAVEVSGDRRRLSPEVENNLFRIGQEALANAVRHAQARRIRVDLDYGDRRVRLSVCDDGRGFDVEAATHAAPGHFGLAGIRERVHNLGGELTVRSGRGDGAELIVEVPVS